jgi:hypothetical protein
MSLIAIANLAERLLDKSLTQAPQGGAGAKSHRVQEEDAQRVASQDQFTPSAVTKERESSAQAAGLFRATQVTFFSAAADFLLAQTAPQTANTVAAAPAPPTPAPLPKSAQAPISPTPLVPLAPGTTRSSNIQGATTPPVATPNAGAAVLTAVNSALGSKPAASTQSQLQALNSALAALGLAPEEVAQVDRIASLIQDFNPAAFLSLVHQLQAVAQANSPQLTAADASKTATAGSNSPAAASAANTDNTNGAPRGGFQLRELVIKFSGVQETLTGGAHGDTTLQLSAFNLQVEEVNLTLTSSAGQTVQVQAPQRATDAANPNSAVGTQISSKATAAAA